MLCSAGKAFCFWVPSVMQQCKAVGMGVSISNTAVVTYKHVEIKMPQAFSTASEGGKSLKGKLSGVKNPSEGARNHLGKCYKDFHQLCVKKKLKKNRH